MADFEALNELRSRTLRQLREMVAGEPALWARFFDASAPSEVLAHLQSGRERFRALWNQHQEVRRQMVEAGFMPPPVQSDDPFDSPVDDPVRHKIEDTLKAELDAALAAYDCASREFRLFLAQGTGLPAPDGNLRARQIAAAHFAALHQYTSAIRRFNAFLADGKLPAGQSSPKLP